MVFYRHVPAADLEKKESVLGVVEVCATGTKGAPGSGGVSGIFDGPVWLARRIWPGDWV
jgi:hypothetical protein